VGGIKDLQVQPDDVKKWCENYNPCKEYYDLASKAGVHTTKAEKTPIHFSSNKTGMLQSSVKGMAVVVTNLAIQENTIKMTVMVDNLIKGAAGAVLQLAEWVEAGKRLVLSSSSSSPSPSSSLSSAT
jgi:aspartate-semialdehyde dehydrogenase